MLDKLEDIERRFVHIEDSLQNPQLSGEEYIRLTKERSQIEKIVETFRQYKTLVQQKQDAQELIDSDAGDSELVSLAKEELLEAEKSIEKLSYDLKILLLPTDPRDHKNVLLEIRAGTGGDEASLFCADLLRMYSRYAERKKWTIELMSQTESACGGFKEVVLLIKGQKVFSRLKFDVGAHRVQRIPTTESSGRIHTSACTVAVLPEAEEVDVEVNPSDLRIDTYRASGSGGQHVNRTDSAVRITHLPTGIVSECQDERSQHKNKDKAMKMLRSRLLDKLQLQQDKQRSEDRREQVGSGDRSERIRTYNFPQGRVTDHQINLTLYKLLDVMDGDLDEIFDSLGAHHTAEQLKS